VNSIANTVASGSIAIAYTHAYWPPKCRTLRRVQAEAPRTQRAHAETRQDSEHQDERHEAPENPGLEAPHGAQQLARRHGHHGERQHRAPHPQRAAQRGGQAVHRKSPRSSRREAQ